MCLFRASVAIRLVRMFEPGDLILGVYIVEKLLGAGGGGEVYLVRRSLDNMRYAAKTILSGSLESASLRRDLLREIRVSQQLGDHPHLVPTRFFRLVDGQFIVFSDYVGGGTLHRWITSGRVETTEMLLRIALETASGLAAAHKEGIIHKDIKPSNILMETDGRARVSDFGLIRGMTPQFCSPEQAEEQSLTPATDIWSWALVVMMMWLGEPRWILGPHAGTVLGEMRSGPSRRGPAPKELITLLGQCLRLNPSDRPESMTDVFDRMRSIYHQVTGTDWMGLEPMPAPHQTGAFPAPATTRGKAYGSGRKSVLDGLTWDDPRSLLDEISGRLKKYRISVTGLIPELTDSGTGYIDDIHLYMLIEDLLKKLSAEGDPDWLDMLQKVLTRIAWLMMDSGDMKASAEHHRRAAEIIRELILYHNRTDLWCAIGNRFADIGLVHLQRNELKDALENCREAIDLRQRTPARYRDVRFHNDMLITYSNMGIILSRMEDPDASAGAFRESYNIARNLDIDHDSREYLRSLATASYNLGSSLTERGRLAEGLVYLKEAADAQKKVAESGEVNERVLLAKVTAAIAVTLAQLGKNDQAEYFFALAEVTHDGILEQTDHPYVRSRYVLFLRNMARFRMDTGRCEESLALLNKAVAILKEMIRKDGTLENAGLMADLLDVRANCLDMLDMKEEAESDRKTAEDYRRWKS
ncbi:serine/threonine protein kinase [bacterium]|nr:serine/threonine protein kinase [candidate division CSSED10-310 bacterium]